MENEVLIKHERTIINDDNACRIPSQDGSSVGDKVIFSNENEDRIANENGRFPCKYCCQTFSKLIYAMSHEKKSCKRKSNQMKNKLKEEMSIFNGTLVDTRYTMQNIANEVSYTEMNLDVPNPNIKIKTEDCDNSERKEKFETVMVKEEPRFFEESSINVETDHNNIKIEPIEENTLKSESVIIPCDPFNSSIVVPEGNIKNYAPKSGVPNSAPNYKFKCTKCDAKFSDPQAMIVHRIIHGEPNPKIKCTKCEKFFDFSAMKKHYRLSHDKFQCTRCNYRTDKKRNLNKHIEIAHTCKKCSMKCNMQNHSCRMKIKSFKCTICQEKFSEEIAMINHIQSHVKLTNLDAVS